MQCVGKTKDREENEGDKIMSCFVYKCNICRRVEERFDIPIEKRNEEFPCGIIQHEIHSGESKELRGCMGQMIFQPIQKTSFRFPGDEREAQG